MNGLDFLRSSHRKRVRHFEIPGDAHFLTFSCNRRLPLLSKERTRKWFIASLAAARNKHGFQIWAWVIMPEHVHLLIYPERGSSKISSVIADIKRPVAQRAIAFLVEQKLSFLNRLTVYNTSRMYHRFWQAGPGQDHNVYDPKTAHRIVEYIHFNPVRRGLVMRQEDWWWSSARDWLDELDVPIKVDRTIPPIVEFSRP